MRCRASTKPILLVVGRSGLTGWRQPPTSVWAGHAPSRVRCAGHCPPLTGRSQRRTAHIAIRPCVPVSCV